MWLFFHMHVRAQAYDSLEDVVSTPEAGQTAVLGVPFLSLKARKKEKEKRNM